MVGVYWAPLLVKTDIIRSLDGLSVQEVHLHQDIIHDELSSQLKNFDCDSLRWKMVPGYIHLL